MLNILYYILSSRFSSSSLVFFVIFCFKIASIYKEVSINLSASIIILYFSNIIFSLSSSPNFLFIFSSCKNRSQFDIIHSVLCENCRSKLSSIVILIECLFQLSVYSNITPSSF